MIPVIFISSLACWVQILNRFNSEGVFTKGSFYVLVRDTLRKLVLAQFSWQNWLVFFHFFPCFVSSIFAISVPLQVCPLLFWLSFSSSSCCFPISPWRFLVVGCSSSNIWFFWATGSIWVTCFALVDLKLTEIVVLLKFIRIFFFEFHKEWPATFTTVVSYEKSGSNKTFKESTIGAILLTAFRKEASRLLASCSWHSPMASINIPSQLSVSWRGDAWFENSVNRER